MARTTSWEPPGTPFTAVQVGVTWKVIDRARNLGAITRLRHGGYISTEALGDLLGDRELASVWEDIRQVGDNPYRLGDTGGHPASSGARQPGGASQPDGATGQGRADQPENPAEPAGATRPSDGPRQHGLAEPAPARWSPQPRRSGRQVDITTAALRSAHLIAALAEQVSRPELVASHETAALALGIPLLDERAAATGPITLTVPRRSRRGRPGAPNVVERALSGGDVTAAMEPFGDLVVTSAERTAVDITARGDLVAALMAADHVARCSPTSGGNSSD